MIKLATVLFAASVAFAAPAFAQDQSVTLRVDSGSVMSSTGGEFASAGNGQALAAGQKVMVNEGSSATLVYGNGCKMELSQPGVYTVPGECNMVASSSGGSVGAAVGILAGAALIGGGAISQEDNTPAGPLSTGIRSF